MSTAAVQQCNTIRERYYPRAEWPGIQYEAAVTCGHNGDGVLLERIIRPIDGLRHMILGVFNKPTSNGEAAQ